jgi:hypothetical protein
MPPPRSLAHLKREISDRSPPLGRGPYHWQKVQAAEPATPGRDGGRKREGAVLALLPAKDVARPDRQVPGMDDQPPQRRVRVVPVQVADSRMGGAPNRSRTSSPRSTRGSGCRTRRRKRRRVSRQSRWPGRLERRRAGTAPGRKERRTRAEGLLRFPLSLLCLALCL